MTHGSDGGKALDLAEVHPFDEGDLPRRLWRVTS